MLKMNESKGYDEIHGEAGQDMPAGFGLATATFIVIAGMVGAGVLTTSGFTVLDVGSNQRMLFLWALGGITAICGALSVAELSAALPRTGGEYVYLYEAYGPLPAFVAGWVAFLVGFAVPSAAAAFAFAKYMVAPFELPGARSAYLEQALATAAVLTFTLIHLTGRRQTARVQGTITCLKLCGLTAFACAGVSVGWRNSANLLITGLVTAVTAHEHPWVSLCAVLSILGGVPFYYVWQGRGRFLDALRQTSKLKQRESQQNDQDSFV